MPILDPIALDPQQIDVRGRAEQPILKILAKSVIDRQCYDERSDACRNPGDRNPCNDADDSLTPFGAEITRGDKEFKAHERSN